VQVDSECAVQDEPTIECEYADDRNTVKNILQLKSELKSLEEDLKHNRFTELIKKEHETAMENHWYTDYMRAYHM
jgi:hypothetical protein